MAAYFWACSSLASILPEAFCGPLEIKFAGFIRNGVWPNSVVLVEGLWDLIKKPESRYKRDLGPEGCRFEPRCSEHDTDPHCSQGAQKAAHGSLWWWVKFEFTFLSFPLTFTADMGGHRRSHMLSALYFWHMKARQVCSQNASAMPWMISFFHVYVFKHHFFFFFWNPVAGWIGGVHRHDMARRPPFVNC